MDSHGNSKIKVTTVIEADFCSDSEEFRVITAHVFKSHLESKNWVCARLGNFPHRRLVCLPMIYTPYYGSP
jgi:hypothetical protein